MNYDEKIAQAKEIVGSFNGSTEKKIDWENFLKELKAAGGTTDESLTECSWEDLKAIGIPPLMAKQIVKVFRQSSESKPRIINSVRAASMSIRELIQNYTPSESDNAVGERLKSISKGKKFIVFNDDGTTNEASVQLLQELKDGYPERETYTLEGKPKPLYAIGDRPDNLADVNPLYPKRILRPDGTCDQTNRSWNGVSHEVRWLILLGVTQTKEIVVSYENAQAIMDIVVSEDAEQKLAVRYPKAYILYEQLNKESNLPALRTSMGGSLKFEKPNDAFYGDRGHKEF
jgi:hypothetical protein